MIKKFLKNLGPGLITGASDDDPSGILTYLQSGVVLGARSLWTALFTLPLMYGIQEMVGRIGWVSGKGLTRLIKENFSRKILFLIVFISAAAITVNIGADLLAIVVIVGDLFPMNESFLFILVTLAILLGVVFFSYKNFARVLKWLTLSLFLYIAAVFYLKINWIEVLRATVVPSFVFSRDNLMLLTAIFGTTISPYLFFWQANEEVEEEKEDRDKRREEKPLRKILVTKNELKILQKDTFIGMFVSNLVMWFIIAGAAYMASAGGLNMIATFRQAALVLEPFLGKFAYFFFSLGIIGTGVLVIPILAGSIGYMFAETFNLPEGMNKKFSEAKGFYFSIIAAAVLGMILNILGFDPVRLLIYTAVFYTFITPPIIYLMLKIGNSEKIMKKKTNSGISNFLGITALVLSIAVSVAYLVSFF